MIELRGDSAGASVNGLVIDGDGSTVRGFDINRFQQFAGTTGDGIELLSNGNLVAGNYLGTDITGTTADGNALDGIVVLGENNTIGGTGADAANIISGNHVGGLGISGSTGNVVDGNYIGTDPTGTTAIPNQGNGITIMRNAAYNTIGGTTAAARNILSANSGNGILVGGEFNLVQGNYAGTATNGTTALANQVAGIAIVELLSVFPADNNTIGGTAAGAGNLISGNSADGLDVNTSGNLVEGNFIGTEKTGSAALGNAGSGVTIDGNSNIIGGSSARAGNLISGNLGGAAQFDVVGNANVIQGNFIGTDITGTYSLSSSTEGINLQFGCSNNVIGGPTATATASVPSAVGSLAWQTTASVGNLIAGTAGGVNLGSGSGNIVQGNYIGTDVTGAYTVAGDGANGVSDVATDSQIGGTSPGAGNVISGWSVGVSEGGTGTLIQGNRVGSDVSGTKALGNLLIDVLLFGNSATVGGTTSAARNLLVSGGYDSAGDRGTGFAAGEGDLVIYSARNNLVEGNFFGTNPTGTATVGQAQESLLIWQTGASNNTVGGTTAAARNIISDAGTGVAVQVFDGATANTIEGNYVGTDVTGASELNSVSINVGAASNVIGGSVAGAGNTIDGGVQLYGNGNLVQGNYIGTNATGTAILPGGSGVIIGVSNAPANGNTVGGTTQAARNVIAGSSSNGVTIAGSGSTGNVVEGNYIGTNAAGTSALANNGDGVLIESGAAKNTIGGTGTAAANVISGNSGYGIQVDGSTTTGNVVANNYVGTGAGGMGTLLNGSGALEITNGAAVLALGAFTGNVLNQGTLGFWNAPGAITITGNYTQSAGAILDISIAGTANSQYDQLQVSGNATLAGSLDVAVLNSFAINPLEEFGILSYGSVSGTFTTYQYPGGVTLYPSYESTSLYLYSTPFALVSSTADTGVGSLRQAITAADSSGNALTWIVFHIPTSDSGYNSGTGSWTIAPASALPTITTPVVLDGTTQPGYSTHPLIELRGDSAGTSDGLAISAGGSTVRGLDINRFQYSGIDLTALGGDVIAGNFLGTDITGTQAEGNGNGVLVDGGNNDVISSNLVSGNFDGVFVTNGSSETSIAGNLIGTDVSGIHALGNQYGISINSATNTTIGGTTAAARNVISGNIVAGISLGGGGTAGTVFEGNYIGADSTGTAPLGNGQEGVEVYTGASGITIGGTSAADGNVISGNTSGSGVLVNGASGIVIAGNHIGTDATGLHKLANVTGVWFHNANNNTVGAGNVISGNSQVGVKIDGTGGTGNVVVGNDIGTDETGGTALANNIDGVLINNSATGNTIGGLTNAAANLISGNSSYGIVVDGSATTGNVVEGNYVGTGAGGSGTLLNGGGALTITNGAALLVAGSFTGDVVNQGSLSTANGPAVITITGNYTENSSAILNIQAAGSNASTPAFDQLIVSGTATLAGTLNVTLLNGFVPDPTQSFTVVSGHPVSGTYATVNLPSYAGRTLFSAQYTGTALVLTGTTIVVNSTGDAGSQGGGSPDTGNLVGGKAQITLRSAIQAADAATGTSYIYFDIPTSDGGYSSSTASWTVTPGSALPAVTASVILDATTQPGYSAHPLIELDGASAGTGVTGLTISAGNSTVKGLDIGGFSGDGIDLTTNGDDLIESDYIGTDATGTTALANANNGITSTSSANTIGGSTSTPGTGAGNVISGNTAIGLEILNTSNNVVAGNIIGLNAAGTAKVGNGTDGIFISGAFANMIGGTTSLSRNIISGTSNLSTGDRGVDIENGATGNVVAGNYIGTDITGTLALGNTGSGIFLSSAGNTIGGTVADARQRYFR